jgi:hypothetical protein
MKGLTSKKIEALRQKHRVDGTQSIYLDGGDLGQGLYLQLSKGGASWLLRYERSGRERWCGLGSYRNFSLKEARLRAREKRQLIADGIDPIDQKKELKAAQALAAIKSITFEHSRSIRAPRGDTWHPTAVARLLNRLSNASSGHVN